MVLQGLLGGAVGGASVNIVIRAIDNYSKEFKKLDTDVQKQMTSFQKLGLFLSKSGIGYAILAGAAIGFGISAVSSALKSERAVQQFNLALGDAANKMRIDLRRAARGMVSDFELINAANRGLALGIKQNDLIPLMEVAVARSKIFGSTVTDAFNDITIGIGRQSRMILDNLGIIVDLDKTYQIYAETIGKTASQLTDMEKKQALVNAVIAESEVLVKAQAFILETHADKLQRLNAQWQNLKNNVGLAILEFYDVVTAAELTDDTLFDMAVNITKLSGEVKMAEDNLRGLEESLSSMGKVTLKGELENLTKIADKENQIAELKRMYFDEDDSNKRESINNIIDLINKDLDKLQAIDNEYQATKKLEQAKASQFMGEKKGIEESIEDYKKRNQVTQQSWIDEKQRVKELTAEILKATTAAENYARVLQSQLLRSNITSRGTIEQPIPTGPNMTINIDNVNGIDGEGVSKNMLELLNTKIRI